MWPFEVNSPSLDTRCKYTQLQEIYGLTNRPELNGMIVKWMKNTDDGKEEVVEATKFQEVYKTDDSKIKPNTPIFRIKRSNLRYWYGLDPWINTLEFYFRVRTECFNARKKKKNNSGQEDKSDEDETDDDETILAVYFSPIHYGKDIKVHDNDYERIVLPETQIIFKSEYGEVNNYRVHSPDERGFQLNDLLEALRVFVFKEQTVYYNPDHCRFEGFKTGRCEDVIVLSPSFGS